MEGLKTLLAEVAELSKPYDVVDRAATTVRRRHRLVRLAPVAAAALVALVGTAGWSYQPLSWLRRDRGVPTLLGRHGGFAAPAWRAANAWRSEFCGQS